MIHESGAQYVIDNCDAVHVRIRRLYETLQPGQV